MTSLRLRPSATKTTLFLDRACEQLFAGHLRAWQPILVDTQELPDKVLRSGSILLLRINRHAEAETLKAVRSIRRQSPFVVILLVVHWDDLSEVPLNKYVRAGADDLLTFGRGEAIDAAADYVALRLRTPPPSQELAELDRRYERSAQLAAVSHGIRNGSIHLTAAQLAQRFGYAARTLREQLAAAGFPCPRDVVRCGWFLNLAELREHEAKSAEESARLLGFVDATDLRKKRSQFRASVASDTRLASFVSGFPRLLAIIARARDSTGYDSTDQLWLS